MATDLSSLYDALRNADAAGDTAGAQRLAAYIKTQSGPKSFDLVNGQTVPTGSAAAKAAQSPVSDSATQNFLAGAGKATMDIGRGAGQMVGAVSRQDVADARARDAPLMKTKAGVAGNLTGTAVDLLPAALIPGAGTMAGAAAIGAGTGLLMPSTGTGETLANTALGGAAGPLGLAAGRGLGALYQGGKAAIMPFLPGGSQQVAANTLRTAAGGRQAATQAAQELTNPGSVLPGVQPSVGELTSNGGLAQLQRTLQNNSAADFTARDAANRGAMTSALDQMSGTAAQRTTNVGLRADFTKPLYEQAEKARVVPDKGLQSLLSRPSMQSAWERAQQLAAERGEQLEVPQMAAAMGKPFPIQGATPMLSGKSLQYLRMGLSDLADSGPQQGMGAHEAAALKNTLSDLNGWIGKNVPALKAADRTYAWASRPLNQSDIAGQLRDRLVPALGDFGNGVPRLNANSYATALRNGDDLAANVLGRQNAKLADVMSPQQTTTLNQIGDQLARRANASDLGRGAGSNTAQNLAGQNLLHSFLGPFGMSDTALGRMAQSAVGKTIARPYGFAAQAAEPDIQRALTEAMLDPRKAAQLLQQYPNSRLAQILWHRQGLLGPATQTAAQGLMGSGNAAQQ